MILTLQALKVGGMDLERLVDVVMHASPLILLGISWRLVLAVRSDDQQSRWRDHVLLSILSISYLAMFVADLISLPRQALHDQILFSRLGLWLIYCNLGVAAVCALVVFLKPSRISRSIGVSAALVLVLCLIDLLRAVDVGI